MRPQIIDAEFRVLRGPLRAGDRHPRRRLFRFTGAYDSDGHPLFYCRWLDVTWYVDVVGKTAIWCGLALVGLVGVCGVLTALNVPPFH